MSTHGKRKVSRPARPEVVEAARQARRTGAVVGAGAGAPSPLDAALDAVRALAVDTLHSARATRFHDASTLCALGQSLVRVFSQSVEDFDPSQANYCGGNVPFMNPIPMGGGGLPRPYRAALQGNDQQNLRNVALGMDDTLRIQAEASRATIAANAAAELKDLVAVRKMLSADSDAAKITATRMIALLDGMETRNAAPPPPAPAPVFTPLADLADVGLPRPMVPAQRAR